MKLTNLNIAYRTLSLLLILFTICACNKTIGMTDFKPDFSVEKNPDIPNTMEFTNKTIGTHTFVKWDFGNGEETDKLMYNNKHSVFYPLKGDYTVTLSVWNAVNVKKTVSKTVSITNSLFAIDFEVTIDSNNSNYANITNTTAGEYDDISWNINGTKIEKDPNSFTAYFAFKGDYDITLRVAKGDFEKSLTKKITIENDDPDYLNKYKLIWSDEFDNTDVNLDFWTYETGDNGWGNNELQNYTNGNNVEVKDGKLIITARKVDDKKAVGSYTSARMITKGKKEFTYGRYEIRAKLPSGTGIWPAIWMLGSNINDVGWPACGEIDIMEYVGFEPNVIHSTVHTPSGYGSNGNGNNKTLPTCEEEFHTYGLIWTLSKMIFYVDSPDNVTFTYAPSNKNSENWPFDKPHFFILNIAVGGNWGGAKGIDNSIFPQTLEIDYIRVFQINY